MNPVTLKMQIVDWTVKNSGMEVRHYLGMSRINECPRLLARELTHDRRWTEADALRSYAGYLWEADVKVRLEKLGFYRRGSERELVADFDHRFMGHTDGELRDGSLLEIKSTIGDKLAAIKGERRLPIANYRQVQTYMRHGGYAQAMMIYVARDTGEVYTQEVTPLARVMDLLDEKARGILAAVDAGELPLCTCGRCDPHPQGK